MAKEAKYDGNGDARFIWVSDKTTSPSRYEGERAFESEQLAGEPELAVALLAEKKGWTWIATKLNAQTHTDHKNAARTFTGGLTTEAKLGIIAKAMADGQPELVQTLCEGKDNPDTWVAYQDTSMRFNF